MTSLLTKRNKIAIILYVAFVVTVVALFASLMKGM